MRAVILIIATVLVCTSASRNEKKILCYFGSWAVHSPSNGNMDINQINPMLCTHLIYRLVSVNKDGSFRVTDPWRDLSSSEPGGGLDGFQKFNRLRGINPSAKTLISIGDWKEDPAKFSKVAAHSATRAAFVENAVRFVRKYGFDGLDINWEYRNRNGGVEADKQNFVLCLKRLRERFDDEGLILSVKVSATESLAKLSYIIPEIAKYPHFINLFTSDMHGSWNQKTGINAPVYAGSWELDDARQNNVNASVHYWLSQGVPAEKLVLGVPAFGRTFTLDNPNDNGIGAPAHKKGNPGPYSGSDMFQGYNEICEAQLAGGWVIKFQDEQRVPYAFKGDQWIGYDNLESVREKTELVNELGLGGAMFWHLEWDDFRGICGETFPLLKTLNRALVPQSQSPHHYPSELGGDLDGFHKFNRLRGVNPSAKTLVTIGNWDDDTVTFSKVVAHAATRAAFVENASYTESVAGGVIGGLGGVTDETLTDVARNVNVLRYKPAETVDGTVDGRGVGKTANGLTADLVGILGHALKGVGETVNGLMNHLEGILGGTLKGVGGTVNSLTKNLGNTLGETTNEVGGTVKGSTRHLGDTVHGTLTGVGKTVNGLTGNLLVGL